MLIGIADHDLLDFWAGEGSFFAKNGYIHWDLTPTIDGVAKTQDFVFHQGTGMFLGAKIGARQEHHAQGNAALRLMTRAADMLMEKFLVNFHMDAGTITCLTIGIHRTTVPNSFQGLNTHLHHPTGCLAFDIGHKANPTSIMFVGRIIKSKTALLIHVCCSFKKRIRKPRQFCRTLH